MSKKVKIFLILFFLVVAVTAYFFLFPKEEEVEYITYETASGELNQTVSEVGTVKATKEINLNFLQAGTIKEISVDIGDEVKKDDILAELDYSSLTIKEQEAKANLDVAKANLNKIIAGATLKEIAVSKANVEQAKTSHLSALEEYKKIKDTIDENIAQAEKELYDLESDLSINITPEEQSIKTAEISLKNTKNTYQQVINNKEDTLLITMEDKLSVAKTALDNVYTIISDKTIDNYLSARNINHLNNTKDAYDEAIELLDEAEESLDSAKINLTEYNIKKASADTIDCLNLVFDTLNNCYSALEASITSTNFTQTTLDTHKTNINTKLTAVSTAISTMQTAKQGLDDAILNYETKVSEAEDLLAQKEIALNDAIKNAKNSLSSTKFSGEQQLAIAKTKVDSTLESWDLAVAQLEELESPARNEDISLNRAKVEQAEAALKLVQKQIEDSIIKAPIDGRVSKVEYEVGEQIATNNIIITILGDESFEIEVDISEADIAKIKIGNMTEITFDAFGEKIKASGRVEFIEPAETVIQDVIYYKVTIRFDAKSFSEELLVKGYKEINIKSGMTANVVISTASRQDALNIPVRAVIDRNGSGKFVKVLENGIVNEVLVETGIVDDEGQVEILSGLRIGDVVIVGTKSSK